MAASDAEPNGNLDGLPFTAPSGYVSPEIAGTYDRSRYEHFRGRLVNSLQQRALAKCLYGLPRSLSVLEVACGTGRFSVQLAGYFAKFTASDVSPAMLAVVSKRLGSGAKLCLADGRDLPFGDSSFELVAAMFLLGHAPKAVRGELLSEFRRVSSGYVVVSMPLTDRMVARTKVRLRRQYYPHRTYYPTTKSRFRDELLAVGLTPVKWIPVLAPVAVTWFVLAQRPPTRAGSYQQQDVAVRPLPNDHFDSCQLPER